MITGMKAVADEDRAVTRNTWMIWKRKYQAWTCSSAVTMVGCPEALATSVKVRRQLCGLQDLRALRKEI